MKESASAALVIAGQPNCGKTSIFNALTGSHQYVGNWPGVTVEKKEGKLSSGEREISVTDLPGCYALTPFTLEEGVSRAFLLEGDYDLILNVIDGTQLERQLYLTIQILSLKRPTILVINMMDEVSESGKKIDTERLSWLLGIPVIPVVARTGEGMEELKSLIVQLIKNPALAPQKWETGDAFYATVLSAARYLRGLHFPEFKALKYLEHDEETEKEIETALPEALPLVIKIRDEMEQKTRRLGGLAASDWIHGVSRGIQAEVVSTVPRPESRKKRILAGIDKAALGRFSGVPLFFLVLFLMFQATFIMGDLIIGLLEFGLDAVTGLFEGMSSSLLSSFLSDGVLGGVGNVLLLTPYVGIMFLLLSFLEDSGYMARAAFVMDRFMHKLGLHGKAFIPLVMGFGCNVPAIMAARTLETQNERLKTILMVPFMSCSARLPVYVVFAGAFFGRRAGLVVFSLYLAGILAGILTGLLLSKTYLRDSSEGLIMELPPYRLPLLKSLLINTWNKTKGYIEKAGTLILVVSVVLWGISYFPSGVEFGGPESIIGRIGRFLQPVFAPLGFDFRMTAALISGFVAKEVVISTLGILLTAGENLHAALQAIMTAPVALAYLVFILLYTPCLATVAVMRSETGSAKWTAISVGYGLIVAWISAFLVKAIASLFT